MKRIVWLASYPKSGNTWFRAFLANFLRDPDVPVNINQIQTGPIASARMPLDTALGYDSSDLTFEEIDSLRREHFLACGEEEGAPLFFKVHDAYTCTSAGQPLFPPEVSLAVIYLVRNPLDVCVSFAHHCGRSEYDRVIKSMSRPEHAMAGNVRRHNDQLRQRMLSWSGHVASWRDAAGHRVKILRYEDMKQNTLQTFTEAIGFLGLPTDERRVKKALEFSSFEELSRQEEKNGFRERVHAERKFFRKGVVGDAQRTLSESQKATIRTDHESMMRQMNYL